MAKTEREIQIRTLGSLLTYNLLQFLFFLLLFLLISGAQLLVESGIAGTGLDYS